MKKRRSERRDLEMPTANSSFGSVKIAIVSLLGIIAVELIVVAILFTGDNSSKDPKTKGGLELTLDKDPETDRSDPVEDAIPTDNITTPDLSTYIPSMNEPIRRIPQGRMETVVVYEVISGDTLKLEDDVELRLIGIQAPSEKEPLFQDASDALAELIRGKKVLAVSDEKATDRYKRKLAYVYVDGVFVNAELVRLGYAYASRWGKNTRHARFLKEVQFDARGAKRGQWSLEIPSASFYITTPRARYFHRPDCKLIGKGERRRIPERDKAFNRELVPCRTCQP